MDVTQITAPGDPAQRIAPSALSEQSRALSDRASRFAQAMTGDYVTPRVATALLTYADGRVEFNVTIGTVSMFDGFRAKMTERALADIAAEAANAGRSLVGPVLSTYEVTMGYGDDAWRPWDPDSPKDRDRTDPTWIVRVHIECATRPLLTLVDGIAGRLAAKGLAGESL